jgi:transcriptional regulator with XRE-family HTH domain
MTLQELRENADKSQYEIAAVSGVSQMEISRAERRTDHRVSTLRRYVRALGGELEVFARFPRKVVRLRGV